MFESVRVAPTGQSRVLLVAHFKGEGLDRATAALDSAGSLKAALARPEATGEAGACAEVMPAPAPFDRALIVGLGERKSFRPAALRAVAGSVGRRLSQIREGRIRVEIGNALASARADIAECGRCFGEGLGLVGFSGEQFKGSATTKRNAPIAVLVRSGDAALADGIERGLSLAAGSNLARTLSNTPPNIATPAYMAEQARRIARKHGMKCDVISGPALVRERLTGLATVGAASENKPCLIRLEYTPGAKGRKAAAPRARSGRPLVLIGKTLTYDTGGLSLKINNGMVGMKRDKDGGCAVLGAMLAIAAEVRPRRRVVALLAAAENSISDEAYRPDDILTFRNGVTVEITNTDAEGRLVLADALCWACDREDPAAIVDVATLTGGVVTALGSTYAGLWCDDDALRSKIEAAADATGERVWRLPMHQEYRDMMKSPVADILNSNPNRKAHPIQGAAFLSYFVKEGIPWCHLDIAGTHVADKESGPIAPGPTGWGARILAELSGAL